MDVSALTRKAASQGAASYRDVGLIRSGNEGSAWDSKQSSGRLCLN